MNCLNKTWKLFLVIFIVLFEFMKICVNYLIWFSNFLLKLFKFNYILCSIKALCFVSLIYTSVLVTLDFFEYPYVFKLNINNNINGFDLPPISFCTETNVLFDKNKIIEKYNESQEFQEFRAKDQKRAEELRTNQMNRIRSIFENEKDFLDRFSVTFDSSNHYSKSNFDKNNKFVDELSFEEKRNLMIRANHMINCSAKLHSRYDSNEYKIGKCFKDFKVIESIYGNQDFGICYTFFWFK